MVLASKTPIPTQLLAQLPQTVALQQVELFGLAAPIQRSNKENSYMGVQNCFCFGGTGCGIFLAFRSGSLSLCFEMGFLCFPCVFNGFPTFSLLVHCFSVIFLAFSLVLLHFLFFRSASPPRRWEDLDLAPRCLVVVPLLLLICRIQAKNLHPARAL